MHRVPSFRVSRNSQEELVRESQTDVGKSKGVSAVFRFLVRNIYFKMFVVCSVRIYDKDTSQIRDVISPNNVVFPHLGD